MKRFFRKLAEYFERPTAYWPEMGMLYGTEDWPLALALAEERARSRRRTVTYAPVLDDGTGEEYEGIRIRARIDPHFDEICHFMVDRPVLPGYSAHFSTIEEAADSFLAASLFSVGGVTDVVLWESLVEVTRDAAIDEDWRIMGNEIGERIRFCLESGQPAVSPVWFKHIPPEEDLIGRVQKVIDDQINPMLSSHQGLVTLERVEANTIWINMGGSCQGCAASPLTLRHGVGEMIRQTVPEVGAIYDATDHSAGVNPYFRELPREQRWR